MLRDRDRDTFDRRLWCPLRAIAVRPGLEVCLEDRLKDQFQCSLNHAVADRRDREDAHLAMNTADVISLIASVVSLAFSIFAIWLTWQIKKDADRVNQKTIDLLIDIKSNAMAATDIARGELVKYGEVSRQALGMMSASVANVSTQPGTTVRAATKQEGEE